MSYRCSRCGIVVRIIPTPHPPLSFLVLCSVGVARKLVLTDAATAALQSYANASSDICQRRNSWSMPHCSRGPLCSQRQTHTKTPLWLLRMALLCVKNITCFNHSHQSLIRPVIKHVHPPPPQPLSITLSFSAEKMTLLYLLPTVYSSGAGPSVSHCHCLSRQ